MFSKTPAYMAINTPHANLHTNALTALSYVKEPNHIVKQRTSLVENMSNVESESFKLFDLFKDMVAQANPKVKF